MIFLTQNIQIVFWHKLKDSGIIIKLNHASILYLHHLFFGASTSPSYEIDALLLLFTESVAPPSKKILK